MGKREILGGVLLVVLAGAIAAMTQVGAKVFPHSESVTFRIGLTVAILALIGLLLLFVFQPKRRENSKIRPDTTSFRASGGDIEVGELDSSADNVADVKSGRLRFGKVRHAPSAGASRRQAADSPTAPDNGDQ